MSSSGGAGHLVTMANDIANYFHSESDRELAVDGIVGHITKFWDPRMHKKMQAHFEQHGGEGLNELALAAITRLAEQSKRAAA
jgi:formate dehydrogenase subunit delta